MADNTNYSHLAEAFHQIYDHMNKHAIKESVDKIGVDAFITECARFAAVTGAAANLGGAITMIVGVPVDLVNNVVQQFRVTLAVIYARRGTYDISFEEFMKIVAVSLGVEAGLTMTKAMLLRIAAIILAKLTPSVALKWIPIASSVVSGTVNYAFIMGIGKSVKALNL